MNASNLCCLIAFLVFVAGFIVRARDPQPMSAGDLFAFVGLIVLAAVGACKGIAWRS